MTSEDETFKHLRRQPFAQVQTIIVESSMITLDNYVFNSLNSAQVKFLKYITSINGWDYEDFIAEKQRRDQLKMDNFVERYRARVNRPKKNPQ